MPARRSTGEPPGGLIRPLPEPFQELNFMADQSDILKPTDAHATGEEITTQDAHATGSPLKPTDAHATGEEITTLDAHATSEPAK
jgi:hypothetical protein